MAEVGLEALLKVPLGTLWEFFRFDCFKYL